jgi:hypothetical protein
MWFLIIVVIPAIAMIMGAICAGCDGGLGTDHERKQWEQWKQERQARRKADLAEWERYSTLSWRKRQAYEWKKHH